MKPKTTSKNETTPRTGEGLRVDMGVCVRALNAGLFVSPGIGIHPDRVIDSHELILVRSGTLGMAEEDRIFEVHADQTLLLFPGRRHRGTKPYGVGLSFYWIHFQIPDTGRDTKPRKHKSFAKKGTRREDRDPSDTTELQLPPLATPARPERLRELFHRFLDDQKSGRMDPVQANLLVMLMLSEAGHGRDESDASEKTAAVVGRAEAYIDANFYKQISAGSVAEALGYNCDYLSRLFRKQHGRNLTEFIQRRRVQEAAAALRDTTLPMKQIAARCGFVDPGYLRRIFSRHEGMGPAAYRKLYTRVHVNVR